MLLIIIICYSASILGTFLSCTGIMFAIYCVLGCMSASQVKGSPLFGAEQLSTCCLVLLNIGQVAGVNTPIAMRQVLPQWDRAISLTKIHEFGTSQA